MKITEEIIKISVRELVEFVLRQGSIRGSSTPTGNRALIGTLAHKKLQDNMQAGYEAEVRLVYNCEIDGITYQIEGRADGIITDLTGVVVDEIKTTTVDLDEIDETFNHLHWAQAQCYAYFYSKQNSLGDIGVQLTYYNINTKETKQLLKYFKQEALAQFFNTLITHYHKWIAFYRAWIIKRDTSLKALGFPFEHYRKGQRALAGSVYKAIRQNELLFINAPTGIGKTISTLFPALKAMGEGNGSKIFYLTAKTVTRTVAEEGIIRLQQQGAQIKVLTLTAKDKVCFCEKRQCHPDFCKWADGYYDRVDHATFDIINKENLLTREVIERYAKQYQLCPFELALDLSLWVDVIICDYNYVFDPSVGLKRFLDCKDFVVLVDEAHNLVDRAREMYSADLSKKQVLAVRKGLDKTFPEIRKALGKLNECLLELRRIYTAASGIYVSKEAPDALYKSVKAFLAACDKKLSQKGCEFPPELLDFYFTAYDFNRVYENFDTHYICYGQERGSEAYIKLFCLDPSKEISDITALYKSVVFFSATLLPIDYFKNMLGAPDTCALNFETPFNKEHTLRLMATNISTRYKARTESLFQLCEYIEAVARQKKGHYIVFFPSYKYMQEAYEAFVEEKLSSLNQTKLYIQESNMTEEDREAFLEHFEGMHETTINFCVLGGIFSEGIDLVGEKLIGVIVVGVGLPQIGEERDLIKDYFDEAQKEGYHYAYTYPGINKVLQAVGRLIRTREDKGVILLIDDRYRTPRYQQLLPAPYEPVYDKRTLELAVRHFWEVN